MIKGSCIRFKLVIDGFHIRAGYKKRFLNWPNVDQIALIIDSMIEGIGQCLHERTGIDICLGNWVYCDALLSDQDEARIRNYVEEQQNLPPSDVAELEFDLSRYVEARALFSAGTNESFRTEANAIITELEVGKNSFIRFPPRQTGVDTIIATEMIASSLENDVVVIVSKDGGFAYAVKRLGEMDPNLTVLNLNYEPNSYGRKLRESCSGYFTADESGKITTEFFKEGMEITGGHVTLKISKSEDDS